MREHKTWLTKCNKNNNKKLFKKIKNNILIGLLKKVPLNNIFFSFQTCPMIYPPICTNFLTISLSSSSNSESKYGKKIAVKFKVNTFLDSFVTMADWKVATNSSHPRCMPFCDVTLLFLSLRDRINFVTTRIWNSLWSVLTSEMVSWVIQAEAWKVWEFGDLPFLLLESLLPPWGLPGWHEW